MNLLSLLSLVKDNQIISLIPSKIIRYTRKREVQLPPVDADSILVDEAAPQTLRNKQLSLPKINENAPLTATSTELNQLDGINLQAELDNKQQDVISARGDLVVGDVSGEPIRLAIGTDGQVLTSDGTTAGWEALPAATATESGFVAPRTVQKNLTVTSSVAFTSYRAVGIAYQDFGGVWRLKFNIGGSVASGSRTGTALTVSGVTFKSGFIQAVSSLIDSLLHQPRNAYTSQNASTIVVTHPTDTTTAYYVSGDVELDSKPTWA